jgi:Crp-like helix-turn-helix domain
VAPSSPQVFGRAGKSSVLVKPKGFSVEMMQPGVLLMLPNSELGPLSMRIPRFGWNVTRALALIAEWALERTVHLASDAVSQRVAWALVALVHMQNALRDDGSAIIENISQEELARLVNASRPWVTETLTKFEKSALVRRAWRKIIIPDVRRLRHMVDE